MNEGQVRRLAVQLLIVGAGILVVALALYELNVRGTSGVTGISVADYAAEAQTEASPASDSALPSLMGEGTVSLSSYRGSIVVLNFWATWCDPCRKEAPGLERTWRLYRGRGVQFLGVDERDNDAAARAFVREFSITYPSGTDAPGKLAFDYALFGMPTTLVIDGSGEIRYKFVGYLTEGPLRKALDDVLGRDGP